MAFAETAKLNRIVTGVCPVKITLAGDVAAGDCLEYNSGWTTYTNVAQPLLIAGQEGVSGDIITAYPLGTVVVTHTSTNTATDGNVSALEDTGLYAVAASGDPDVGFCSSVASGSLTSIHVVFPGVVGIDTPRA